MNKCSVLILALMAVSSLSAATVLWDSGTEVKKISGGQASEYFRDLGGDFSAVFFAVISGSTLTFDHLGWLTDRAAIANVGDVVDANWVFDEAFPSATLQIDGDGVYLAWRLGIGDDESSSYYKNAYGWIHIYEEGDKVLASSAFNIDGGAMYVGGGAVPEPTSGLLMLLGAMVIMLRRRSRPIRSHECSIHHADAPHVLSEKPVPSAG